MIRLFKHYIPHAVMLLGLLDLLLLCGAGELAWHLRATQAGIDIAPLSERMVPVVGFAVVVWTAMISVGVYSSMALLSLRYASARILVAISLGIIALSVLDFLLPGSMFWRSTLLFAMVLAILILLVNRVVTGAVIGTSAFRRRVMVLGAGPRAERLRCLSERPESGFTIVSFIRMSEGTSVVAEAIAREHARIALGNLSSAFGAGAAEPVPGLALIRR